MAKQLIHLGSQVVLNFTVADENGNVTMPMGTDANGKPAPFFPKVLDVSRLDPAAFEEIEAVVNALIAEWKAAFCPEAAAADDAPAPEPDNTVDLTPVLVAAKKKPARRQ
jgi:hypothetical protein